MVNNPQQNKRKYNLLDKCPYLHIPKGWDCLKSKGIGFFVTKAKLKSPSGQIVNWKSRYHRKHHSNLEKNHGSTWWAPRS